MRNSGFSILEALIVLTLVAVLLGLAVPALSQISLDTRRRADINAMIAAIEFARSEAAKRTAPVTLCPGRAATGCGPRNAHFESGWVVMTEGPGATEILLAYEPVMRGAIRANRNRFTFRPFYRRSTNGTITFCDRRGPAAAREVIVSYTGRPRVAASTRAAGTPTCGD